MKTLKSLIRKTALFIAAHLLAICYKDSTELIVSCAVTSLKKSLKHCGNNVHFQWPVEITSAENVSIGDDSGFSAFTHIWGYGGVSIGSRVMVGAHTSISSTTHDYNQPDMFKTLIRKKVTIEDDVWIGSNCVILPGVTLHRGCVIGAGAVVTKDVPPNAIVAGVPARLLKFRPTLT